MAGPTANNGPYQYEDNAARVRDMSDAMLLAVYSALRNGTGYGDARAEQIASAKTEIEAEVERRRLVTSTKSALTSDVGATTPTATSSEACCDIMTRIMFGAAAMALVWYLNRKK